MANQPAKKPTPWYVWVLIVVIVLYFVQDYMRTQNTNESRSCLDVKTNGWYAGGFGAIGIFDITIANKCDKDLKDIKLQVNYYAESGTKLGDTEHTIYEVLKAKQTKRYKELNIGFINAQSKRADVAIVGSAEVK